jgi:hypothetical protein
MQLHAVLISAALVAMALAGCAGDDGSTTETGTGTGTTGTKTGTGNTGTTTGTTTQGTTSGGTTTGTTTGTAGNQAPTGSISASGLGGPIPLNVTFDLAGNDPDGDPLDWHLDLDGDGQADKSGKALPAQVSHNYTAAGTYNVTFAITDGRLTTTYNVSINATAGGGGPIQVVDGGYAAGFGAGCSPVGGYLSLWSGVFDHQSFALDTATAGRTFTTTFQSTGAVVNYVVQFWKGGNTIVQTYQGSSSPVTGTVPADSDQVIVSSCGGAQVTFHYEA